MTQKEQRKKERKERMALEKKKLKEMKSFRDRVDYIWEYYKLPIVSTILFIFFVGYIVNTMWINPPDKTAVGLVITSSLFETADVFKEKSEQDINIEDGYEITITSLPFGIGDDLQYQRAVQQKFQVMLAARELDLVIGVEEFFNDVNSSDQLFFDLSQVLDTSQYDTLKDRFIYALVPISILEEGTYTEDEIVDFTNEYSLEKEVIKTVKRPIAVRLDDCKVLKDSGFYTQGTAIGFITASNRQDMALNLFNYIVNN